MPLILRQASGHTRVGMSSVCTTAMPLGLLNSLAILASSLLGATPREQVRPVVTESEPVSMSRETTFDRDLHAVRDRAELGAVFTRLCEQVAADLQRKGYVGKTIGVKLRFDDFKIVTRDHTLPAPVNGAADIRRAAGLALKRAPLQRRLRLLGVRVGGLSRPGEVDAPEATPTTPSLFD